MNIFSKNKFVSGFTIIELVVVIAIITMLVSVLISNYPRIQSQFALTRTAYKFGQDLRVAQSMALAGKIYYDSYGVSHPVTGYGVYLDTSGNDQQYRIYANNSAGGNQMGYDANDYIIGEPISTERDVHILSISTGGTTADIFYQPPNPNTTINSGAVTNITITFSLISDSTQIKTVTANSSGFVQVK